jgi:hypothetical protein
MVELILRRRRSQTLQLQRTTRSLLAHMTAKKSFAKLGKKTRQNRRLRKRKTRKTVEGSFFSASKLEGTKHDA